MEGMSNSPDEKLIYFFLLHVCFHSSLFVKPQYSKMVKNYILRVSDTETFWYIMIWVSEKYQAIDIYF